MEQVLSEADGRREDARSCGARAGEPATGVADREAAGRRKSKPDQTGGQGGNERSQDIGDGE